MIPLRFHNDLPEGRFSVRLKLEPICVGNLFLLDVDLKSTKDVRFLAKTPSLTIFSLSWSRVFGIAAWTSASVTARLPLLLFLSFQLTVWVEFTLSRIYGRIIQCKWWILATRIFKIRAVHETLTIIMFQKSISISSSIWRSSKPTCVFDFYI